MGGKQTKIKPFDRYSNASNEKKKAFEEVLVKHIKELETVDMIDLHDVNEYMFHNHRDVYLRMSRQEMATVISENVTRPHIVLPNHVWFIREKTQSTHSAFPNTIR